MEQRRASYSELAKLIRALSGHITHSGPRSGDEIQELADMFYLRLPSSYRQFLGNYGFISMDGLHIFGLADPELTDVPLSDAILMLRLAHPDMPLELVPIEQIDESHFACLISNRSEAPVVLVNVEDPPPLMQMPRIAPDFVTYLYNRLLLLVTSSSGPRRQDASIEQALAVFEKHVQSYQEKFHYDHATGGKLPRSHDWRPYRYCIQDVVFGITVLKHHRAANCLQVDVFLTAQIPEYRPLAGAHALAAFLLSEAYKCGGTMEIRFTPRVEEGRVPQELEELADGHGIRFRRADEGRIAADEAKALYAALTDFAPDLQRRINELEATGRIRMARACYVVHHGVWSKEQVEMIVLGSEFPDMILGGSVQPAERHLYRHCLFHARSALVGGMLDRVVAKRERMSADGIPYDLEDDVRPLNIRFDGDNYAKTYRCPEPVPVPWLYPGGRERELLADIPFQVLVRARDAADLRLHLERDIYQAAQMRVRSGERPTFVLVSRDFTTLSEAFQHRRQDQAETAGVGLLVCPETTLAFDSEAASKLAKSRVLRK